MVELQPLFAQKEKKEFKGDLANDKPIGSSGPQGGSKYGLGPARYRLILDSPVAGVEGIYFWILRFLEDRPPFGLNYVGETGEIKKIEDIYTAGETSSYWGMAEQRKGVQQDKFQQLMANVGQLLKTLFQLVRELRIIDERLEYYEKSNKGDTGAEIALKSIWVDLVEGGSKNPASVLGLASQVGFVTLPDLFFSLHPKNKDSIKQVVENSQLMRGINRKVREVLERKLTQYYIWKEKTYNELMQGKKFKVKYMRQHFHVIRLYLNWLRPYLRNIQRLQMKETREDKDIIAAFETSKIELELLGIKKKYESEGEYGKEVKEFKEFFPVVRVKMKYVAMPEIAFQSEGQRGAVHRGRTIVVIEGFVAQVQKDEDGEVIRDDIAEYEGKAEDDDLQLLASVDEAVLELKDDIEKYLRDDKEEEKKEEKKEEKGESIIGPFKALFEGFKELTGVAGRTGKAKSKNQSEKKTAEGVAKLDAYVVYNIYKKTHGMFTE